MTETFTSLWSSLLPVGRNANTNGYLRFAYNEAEMQCREWFRSECEARGLELETDRNGNMWAWWHTSVATSEKAIVIGSHLDSVPEGGAFDGPLGVVSALAAVDLLKAGGWSPTRDLAIVVFADEEGARFGIACAGSRLLTGELDPDKARSLLGRDGLTMHEAMTRVGFDTSHLGVDTDRLSRIGFFVELHVEQGKALVNENAPVGVATTIWPHGRYRFTFTGRADHAGTTAMRDRQDPMTAFAMTAVQTAQLATTKDVRATFGRLEVIPNGTNAIPSQVNAWLDLRTPTQETLDAMLEELRTSAKQNVYLNGTQVEVIPESVTGITIFDEQLRERVRQAIAGSATRESIPAIATGAGHDAGILAAAGIPTAMIFVRNPTGISHSPEEFAEESDAIIGVRALADAVRELMK